MPNTTQVSNIRAFASLGSEEVGVESLEIRAGIGSPAQATLSYNRATDLHSTRIERPTGASITAAMGREQELSFTSNAPVSFGIRTPYSFEWSGFRCSPGYALSGTGRSSLQIASISQMAAVGRLNMSIYLSVQTPEELVEQSITGSIAKRLRALTEKLIKNWQTFPLVADGKEQALAAAIHTRNTSSVGSTGKSPLQLWYDLLDASEGSTELAGLAEIEASSLLNLNINSALQELLLYSYGDFWGTISAICSMFNLIYRPTIYAPYVGQFTTMDAIVGEPLERSVQIREANIADAQQATWPVSQVLVRGVPTQYLQFANETSSALPPGPMLTSFPEVPGNGGLIHQVSCPRYFTTPNVVSSKEEDVSFYTQPGGLTIAQYREKKAAMMESLTQNRDAVQRMLEQYARQIYLDLALASSISTLSIPFDHTWAVGNTYKVTDSESGQILFTGFLTGMQHSLWVSGGADASADGGTVLQFTHCRFGDFELPGL